MISVPSESLRYYAYVAQSAEINADKTGDVSVVDLLAGHDVADIPVGVDPLAVLPSPNGSAVYVANSGYPSQYAGELDKITTSNILTGNAESKILTNPAIPYSPTDPNGASPDALAMSPDGDHLLVVDEILGVVYDINLKTSSPYQMSTIYLDGQGTTDTSLDPVAIAMSPSGKYAYVLNHNGDSITVIKWSASASDYAFSALQSGSSLDLSAPHGATVSPDGRTLYVTDETGDAVDFESISASDGTLSERLNVPLGISPESVAVAPTGNPIYVAVAGNGSGGSKTAIVDANSGSVTDATSGPVSTGVAVTPDGTDFAVVNSNFCKQQGSLNIYHAGSTTYSYQVPFAFGPNGATNPYSVAISPAFSAPGVVQSTTPPELSGGGINPAEASTVTGMNNVHAGVDTATGAYSLALPGLSAASPGVPLNFAPSYDSLNSSTAGPIGNGWTFPYAMSLAPPSNTPPTANNCQYVVTQENSSVADFLDVANAGGGCTTGEPVSNFGPPARISATLRQAVSGDWASGSKCPSGTTDCIYFQRNGQTKYFFSTDVSAPYPLVGIEDIYGNKVTLAYGGCSSSSKLTSVTAQGDGLSGTRVLTITWGCPDSNSSQDQIETVADQFGRQLTFTYDSLGNLGFYKLSGGGDRIAAHGFEFAYNSNNYLVNWWDPNNSNTTYPNLPSGTVGTTISYDTSSQSCTGIPSFYPALSVSGAQATLEGQPTNPETTIDYGQYDFCKGNGAVSVADPNQNFPTQHSLPANPYSGDTTLDYYVDRSVLTTTSGYGPADAGPVDDNADGHPDAASATTVFVRDPQSLVARETVDPDGGVTAAEFNELGDPVKVTDPNGGVSSSLYNSYNEVTEKTDPLGNTTSYNYGAGSPLLTSVVDPIGHKTRYLQANDGETCEVLSPVSAAPPNNHTIPGSCGTVGTGTGLTTTTFDSYGDVATVTDPDLHVTSHAYDADGELCGTLSARGYATGARLTSCPSAAGGNYLSVYPFRDVFGDVLQTTTPETTGSSGNVWLTYYDKDGHEIAAMKPQDTSCDPTVVPPDCTYTTYYVYDNEGNLVSVANDYQDPTNPNGPDATTYTYDADGNRLSSVSPDGNASGANPDSFRTVYSYDDLGRLIATQDPQGNPSCNPQTTAHCSFVTYQAHDAVGRLVTSTTPPTSAAPDGVETVTTRDLNGNPTETLVEDFSAGKGVAETTDTYNLDNQVTKSIPPDGNASSSRDSYATTNSYDADGRLITSTAPAGEGNTSGQGAGAGTTSYFYDADGNRVAVTNGDGNTGSCNPLATQNCPFTTYYGFDLAERLTSVVAAAGQAANTTTTYSNDEDGNPHVVTNPSGVTTTYSYNSADEETSVAYSDGTPSVTYVPNVDGTRQSMSAGGASPYTYAYGYDLAGRLTGITNGSATVAGYGYDDSSNVTSLTYPSGLAVTDTYLADNELQKTTWGSSNSLTFGYDQAGELNTTTAQAGSSNPTLTTTSSYDDGGRISQLSSTSSAQSSPIFVDNYNTGTAVAIDANGNPTEEMVTTGVTNLPSLYYAYDLANRVNYDATTAPSSLPVPASSQTYTYDKANYVTQGPAVAVSQYYGDGEIETATTAGGNPTSVSFSYDPEQNRIGESSTLSTTSYAFSAAGEMCWSAPTATIPAGGSTPSCSSPPTGDTTYTYDGDGLRNTETTPSGTSSFSWDTQGSIPRLLEDGQNDYIYGPTGTPLAEVALSGGAIDFLLTDRKGSVRDVVSGSTGLSLGYTGYDAYGTPSISGGLTALTPLGFQGGYTDATGLIYFQQRYYDPGTGQFMSLDPLNQMTNSGYTFNKDNPFGYSDPTGKMYCTRHGSQEVCSGANGNSGSVSQPGGGTVPPSPAQLSDYVPPGTQHAAGGNLAGQLAAAANYEATLAREKLLQEQAAIAAAYAAYVKSTTCSVSYAGGQIVCPRVSKYPGVTLNQLQDQLGAGFIAAGGAIGGAELIGAGGEGLAAISEAASAGEFGTGFLLGAGLASGGLILLGVGLIAGSAWLIARFA